MLNIYFEELDYCVMVMYEGCAFKFEAKTMEESWEQARKFALQIATQLGRIGC